MLITVSVGGRNFWVCRVGFPEGSKGARLKELGVSLAHICANKDVKSVDRRVEILISAGVSREFFNGTMVMLHANRAGKNWGEVLETLVDVLRIRIKPQVCPTDSDKIKLCLRDNEVVAQLLVSINLRRMERFTSFRLGRRRRLQPIQF